MPTRDEWIRAKLAKVSWHHSYEILPGVVTPGLQPFHAGRLLDSLGVGADLTGKRALDIGTWDGPLAFELERRGAATVALDVLDPDHTGFNTGREILQSKVEYVRGSVSELTQIVMGQFDLVCFLGVFYHLKDPIKAFEQIGSVLAPDGRVLFEGECLRNYAETVNGDPVAGAAVAAIADSGLPLALCCPGEFKGSPNWLIPNFACLRSWARSAGLEIIRHEFLENAEARPFPQQRVRGVAARISEPVSIERITLEGSSVIVEGSGFSSRSVLNLFADQEEGMILLGGHDPDGRPRIAFTLSGPRRLSFVLPARAAYRPAYLQIVNPPFLSFCRTPLCPLPKAMAAPAALRQSATPGTMTGDGR